MYALDTCSLMFCYNSQSFYSDWMLFALVGVIIGVEIFIVMVGTAVPQSMLNATLVPDLEHPPFVNVSWKQITIC